MLDEKAAINRLKNELESHKKENEDLIRKLAEFKNQADPSHALMVGLYPSRNTDVLMVGLDPSHNTDVFMVGMVLPTTVTFSW